VLLEPLPDRLDVGQVAGLHELPLLRPSGDLPGGVPVGAAEVAEPGGDVVGRVQLRERVDHLEAELRALGLDEDRRQLVADDDAVDLLHEVERHADDLGVLARDERHRRPHAVPAQGVEDPVLAQHVVGGLRQVPHRWAAQHPPVAAALDAEGEVRLALADLRDTSPVPPRPVLDVLVEVGRERLARDERLHIDHACSLARQAACSRPRPGSLN
jgi:hypothetical protein